MIFDTVNPMKGADMREQILQLLRADVTDPKRREFLADRLIDMIDEEIEHAERREHDAGYAEGYDEGYDSGHVDGFEEGQLEIQ